MARLAPDVAMWLVLLLLLAPRAAPSFGAELYLVTDLGAGVFPAAINNDGDVTGTAHSPDGGQQAFLYRTGTLTLLGKMGGTASWGLGINDHGDVVGTVCIYADCRGNPQAPYEDYGRHAFMLKGGRVTDLSATGMVDATEINNYGVILGWRKPRLESQEVVLYESDTGRLIDISGNHGAFFSDLHPIGLNDFGEAVFSESFCSWGCTTPYLYSQGLLQPLPSDEWTPWDATDLNDDGQVPGRTGYYIEGLLYSEGHLISLPVVQGFTFDPAGINDGGLLVGRALDQTQMPEPRPRYKWHPHKPAPDFAQPALFQDGRIVLLQERLADSKDRWVIQRVLDLNDRGEIIGYGVKNGEPDHGLVLTPAERP